MISKYLSLIKFSHTIFALPFALVGFVLAIHESGYGFSIKTLVLVVICMVTARSAAMAFNRWLDRDIDSVNPRTQQREIPAGIISPNSVLLFVILCCLVFIIATYFINRLCFMLSPIALLVVLGYSYTKRFTSLCHIVLGLGLSLAPVGAYLAVTGTFDIIPILFGSVVLLWVAGFDIIYSLQDEEFDRNYNLNSIPSTLGRRRAMHTSRIMHVGTALILIAATYLSFLKFDPLSWIHFFGLVIFLGMLIYQHTLVKSNDLSKVNMAFFTTNGIASIVFGTLFILDFYV